MGQTKFRPLHDMVLVKPVDVDEKTKSGLYLPGSNSEAPTEGVVISVGPGKYTETGFEALSVNPGDSVIYAKFGWDEIYIDEQRHLIMKESSILGIIYRESDSV